MFRNYLRIAVRNLVKRKFYAGLNIGGLAIGMGICLLILQFVAFETSFDLYHSRADDIYRVNIKVLNGDELSSHDQYSWHAMAGVIRNDIPEAEEVARVHPVYGSATVTLPDDDGSTFKTGDFAYVDPAFFKMFDYTIVAGDPVAALESPTGIVLTRAGAERFFGTIDVIGNQINVYSWLNEQYTVGAVVEDHTGNSHLTSTMFAPLQPLIDADSGQYADDAGWSWSNFLTYVLLRSDADPDQVNSKISQAVYAANEEGWISRDRGVETDIQAIADIHLYSAFGDQYEDTGAYQSVLFVGIIGLFVLVIAWLNFINLSTSRAMERAREVGIRKASGARRNQVTAQFVVESLFTNAISLVLALVFAWYGTPWLNELAGTSVSTEIWKNTRLWIILISFFGIGSLLASLYPAFFVSRFQPATILSGELSTSGKGARIRQGMVVFQFALSIALLSGTWIVYSQIQHLRGVDPGFQMDQILVVERPAVIEDVPVYVSDRTAFFEAVRENSSVELATNSTMIPGGGYNMSTTSRKESTAPEDGFVVRAFWIGNEFLETYDIDLLAGRHLDADSEYDQEFASVINMSAARSYGFESAEEAINNRVIVGDGTPSDIVGVVGDFNWMSAKEAATPLLMFPTRGGSFFSLKLAAGSITSTLPWIETLFRDTFPGNAFEYHFGDERFDELYREEVRLMNLVTVFAFFALIVAALGLIGLAALTAARRKKEISVRKVLGAGHVTIARLMTGHFVILVAVATALAIPAVWFVANNWLDQFGSRMSLSIGLFILPALVVFGVSILASSYHTWRLSTSNPIDGIRAN